MRSIAIGRLKKKHSCKLADSMSGRSPARRSFLNIRRKIKSAHHFLNAHAALELVARWHSYLYQQSLVHAQSSTGAGRQDWSIRIVRRGRRMHVAMDLRIQIRGVHARRSAPHSPRCDQATGSACCCGRESVAVGSDPVIVAASPRPTSRCFRTRTENWRPLAPSWSDGRAWRPFLYALHGTGGSR
jgi:hypothetical protein